MASLVVVITLVYSSISPVILLPAIAYFAIALLVWTYNFVYVHKPQFHTGGLWWPIAFNKVIVGLFIYQVLPP